MKKVIHRIRLQPRNVRTTIAFIAAAIITLLIGFLWVSSWATQPYEAPIQKTENPLQSLTQNIKGAFEPTPSLENKGNATIQIIDQGTSPALFDETTPAEPLPTQ